MYELDDYGHVKHIVGPDDTIIPLPPETRYYMEPRFTDDEKDSLTQSLNHFDSKKVNHFITHLELLCINRLHLLGYNRKRVLLTRDYLIKNGKHYLDKLKSVKNGHESAFHKDFIEGKVVNDKFEETYIKYDDENYLCDLLQKSVKAYNALADFIELLEEPPFDIKKSGAQGGRPKADTDKFVFMIAELYWRTFKAKPTGYQEGNFADVVTIALEAVGLPHEYPQKRLKAAIDRLTSSEN
jgi:hypothetical protein